MSAQSNQTQPDTRRFRIVCGNVSETHVGAKATIDRADELYRTTGIRPSIDAAESGPALVAVRPVATPPPPPSAPGATSADFDREGAIRAIANREEAAKAGFAMQRAFFAVGTTLYQSGIDAARAERAGWEALPPSAEALTRLRDAVRAEARDDLAIDARSLRMTAKGNVRVSVDGTDRVYELERDTLGDLAGALTIPGGASYLAACWPRLRAANVNHWAQALDAAVTDGRAEAPRRMMRTRKSGEKRSIYAIVSDRYTAFDVDALAETVNMAIPSSLGARASVSYDGYGSTIDLLWHTDVAPENQVVGEVFRAGLLLRTDDTGGGSVRGNVAIWHALCRNYSYADAGKTAFRIRHVTDPRTLRRTIERAIRDANDRLPGFVKRWNQAARDDVHALAGSAAPRTLEDAIPGFWRSLLDRELAAVLPARSEGARELTIQRFTDAWRSDKSSAVQVAPFSRAAVHNAITRAAHTYSWGSPRTVDALEVAASEILYSDRPIGWVAPSKDGR